jgi:hypothetical protein
MCRYTEVMYEADGVREFLCLWNEDVKVLDGPSAVGPYKL